MRLLIIFSFLLLLTACSKNSNVVEFNHPEGFYKEVYEINSDSVKHGKYLRYYSNGSISDSCQYSEGEIDGVRKIFSEEGKLEIMETHVHGIFHGAYNTYHINGQLKKEQKYQDNKIQGSAYEYYDNGKLKAVINFVDNLENGAFKEYFQNGNIHWEGFFENGNFEQDTLKEYNEGGILLRKLYCDKGICQTVWTPQKGNIITDKIFSNK